MKIYKLAIMVKVILSIFITSLFANDFTPAEQCTYESREFWIKILYLCSEGDVSRDKMAYIGVNKNNGDFIVLTGGHTTLWNGESKEFEDSKIKRISYEKDSIGNAILRMC